MSSPPATTDAYVGSIAELVEALRVDPVHVAQTLGEGRTAEVDAALTTLVDRAQDGGQSVYIALVDDLGTSRDGAAHDASRVIGEALTGSLGDDTWLYVATSDQLDPGWVAAPVTSAVDGGSAALDPFYAAVSAADGATTQPVTPAADAGLFATSILADGEPVPAAAIRTFATTTPWAASEEPAPPVGTDVEDVVIVSVLLGVLVAAVLWRVVRSWVLVGAGRAESAADEAAESEEVRTSGARALDELAARLPGVTGRPRVDDAMSCRVLAERLGGSSDPLDRVGALVLARTGLTLLETGRTFRPCLLNPLHGEAETTAALTTSGGPVHQVPLCARCARRQTPRPRRRSSQAGDPLREPSDRWGRRRSYLEGDGVWARTGFGALDDALWQTVWDERAGAGR